ncbi:MAG: HAMP domain-containing sensor histidine kinase [Thermoanaerobaculia bacterium]
MDHSATMNLKTPLIGVLVMSVAAALIFYGFQRQLTGVWFAVGVHPQVLATLETSLTDQRELAKRDPDAAATYRQRFEETGTLLQRLHILEHNRDLIAGRYELLLLLAFGGTMVLLTGASVVRQNRRETRLARLGVALSDLARGRTDVTVDDRRGDLIGRIAAMIERTSQVMARDRRRLAQMRSLSAWQESARRHAHEMRTPLTGARLELERLTSLLEKESLRHGDDIHLASRSAAQELERLGHFASSFTSFARLPHPAPKLRDPRSLVAEFAHTFASAWSNLELHIAADGEATPEAPIDRDLLRQVLVNLCDNSSLALGEGRGSVRFELGAAADCVHVDVTDDGPGIDEAVRPRLFEPYTTTRGIGEGMGLGLAISKKILLDHGGDLDLLRTSPDGTTFRLTFPRQLPETSETES